MKRILPVILTVVLLVSLFTVPAFAAGSSYVHNPYGVLSAYDGQVLEAKLSALNKSSSVSYHLVVSVFRSDAFEYAYGDTVVFLVEYDEYEQTYYYELFTYGEADLAISDREANRILDDPTVYDNIKSGNIRAGVSRAFELIDIAVYGRLRADNWILKNILISLAIAVIIAGVVCGIIIYKYKKKLKSPIYPLDRYAKLYLIPENSRDVFLHKTLTRVRINTSSGSGSGGRSRGGSRGRR